MYHVSLYRPAEGRLKYTRRWLLLFRFASELKPYWPENPPPIGLTTHPLVDAVHGVRAPTSRPNNESVPYDMNLY